MKKLAVLVCALIPALSAFAYYGDYGYYHSDEMSGFAIFTLIVMIVYIILSIVVLIRWWNMTSNVESIRQHITPDNPKLTYLVAIGEKEQAQKAAINMLVEKLYQIYVNSYQCAKAEEMNNFLESRLPQIEKLGIMLPDYITSGEKFIDYMNGLTGNTVPYEGSAYPTIL
jgi:hypothetical protein